MKLYLLIPVVMLACASSHAEIFKCTDAKGDTQYSDEPCGRNATVFVPEAAPAPAADAAQRMDKTQRLLRAYDAEHAQQRQKDAELRQARAEQKKNCANAQDRLRNVTQARALYRLDEEGNRVVFSDAERSAAEEKARAAVAQWCG